MGAPGFLDLDFTAPDRYNPPLVHQLQLVDNHGQRELCIHWQGVAESRGSICLLLSRAQCEQLAEAASYLAERSPG